ncbi:ABC transporter substrate-binding protein [Salinispirillum marinum]|uniref:ABC transporter substrate-binding protein n=2 Tax=Saccharospirillaceae TaxID=255527 RepID=A0ABV8BA83_9GAMM
MQLRRYGFGIWALALSVMVSAESSANSRVFTDVHGEVTIPAEPQRIVSLQDHVLTMSLVELGAPVAGSAGRMGDDGKPYLRGVQDLLGVDFHNSEIEYVGWTDLEKVVAVNPDLIITTHYESAEMLAQLRLIAPTVTINQNQSLLGFMHDVADVSGRMDVYEARLARYQDRLAEARKAIPDASNISISVINSRDGVLNYWASYGALTQVMDDIGFARPAINAQVSDGNMEVSQERLQDVDADYIIDTFGISWGETPQDARNRMAEVLPNWCSVLEACQNGRYLVFPRTFAFSTSFASLELMTQMLVSHVAGRQ